MPSCLGCKWLFSRDTGYSNYTVENTEAHCVHKRNPALPTEIPDEVREHAHTGSGWGYVWMKPENDKWHATRDGRCELYEFSDKPPLHIDCDGDDIVSIEEGQRLMLEEANPLPLLVAMYFERS